MIFARACACMRVSVRAYECVFVRLYVRVRMCAMCICVCVGITYATTLKFPPEKLIIYRGVKRIEWRKDQRRMEKMRLAVGVRDILEKTVGEEWVKLSRSCEQNGK